EKTGADVWLKLENLQPTGSFKVRGALSKIGRLTEAEKARGIVAASAGNHALGVAHAVASLGAVRADIFVPTTAPAAKINKLRRFPVNLHLAGDTYDAAHQAADAFHKQTGAVEISAYDDLDVIAGQATAAVEIFTELPQLDLIVVPIGGGGICAGITAVSRQINPACHIIGMQPTASPAALLSFRQDRAIDPYDHEPTIADGLAGGFGAVPFEVMRPFSPEILLATEVEIRTAVFTLIDQHQQIVEPSGAIAIAPLLNSAVDLQGKTVVCVLTGGNLDTPLMHQILKEELDTD
ncbi:MAG: pyridoxal-phosphate dependent enzyme, partial [Anaerolineales bacterium]|nr:pyridoxal-phosphate dependent enzyme [Anaerolineales bacterium]